MTRTEIELGGQARAAEVAATLLQVRQDLAARYWMDYPYMRRLVLASERRGGGVREHADAARAERRNAMPRMLRTDLSE